jgi:hypothetical protein
MSDKGRDQTRKLGKRISMPIAHHSGKSLRQQHAPDKDLESRKAHIKDLDKLRDAQSAG